MSASQRPHVDYGFIPRCLRPHFYMKKGIWRVDVKRPNSLKKMMGPINQEAFLFCIFLNEQIHNEQEEKETK